MTTVFKISRPGIDADTAADKDLVFDMSAEVLKTIQSGKTSITLDGSSDGSTTVYHNLGYYPTFMIFYGVEGSYFIGFPNVFADDWDRESSTMVLGAKTDTEKLSFEAKGAVADAGKTLVVYYEIFEQGGYK